MYPGISSTLPQKNSLLCSKMRGVCSIRKGHVRTDMIWGNCQWYFSCMWVLGTSSSEPFPQFQTPDKPAMWASLLEKAVNAGGSICCSFAAHIFRILGMPFSHLFMLSLCFCIRKISDEHLLLSPEGNMTTHLSCFPLPTCLLCRQKTELLPSYCLERQNPMGLFSLLFSEVGVFSSSASLSVLKSHAFNQYCAVTFLAVL